MEEEEASELPGGIVTMHQLSYLITAWGLKYKIINPLSIFFKKGSWKILL